MNLVSLILYLLANIRHGRFPEAECYELFTGHLSERSLKLSSHLGYTGFPEQVVSPRLRLIYLQKPGR